MGERDEKGEKSQYAPLPLSLVPNPRSTIILPSSQGAPLRREDNNASLHLRKFDSRFRVSLSLSVDLNLSGEVADGSPLRYDAFIKETFPIEGSYWNSCSVSMMISQLFSSFVCFWEHLINF